MKYFYLLLVSLSIGCVSFKKNITTKSPPNDKYWLYIDTMTIILQINSRAEVCTYKKDTAEKQYLKRFKADSSTDISHDSIKLRSDTSCFFIKKTRAIRFIKKIIKHSNSLNTKMADKENCEVSLHVDCCSYHLIIRNSFGLFGNSANSPQYYMDKCNNAHDKEFLEVVNEFHQLIGAPKIKPVPRYIF